MSILKPENLFFLRAINKFWGSFEEKKDLEIAFKESFNENLDLAKINNKEKELERTLRLLQLLLERALQARKAFQKGDINKNKYRRKMKITYKEAAEELNKRWNLGISTQGNRLGRHLGILAGFVNFGSFIASRPIIGGLLVRKDTLKPGAGFDTLLEKLGIDLSYDVENDVENFFKEIFD